MLKKSLYFTHKIREFLRNYLVYYKLIKAVNKLNILFNKSDKELRRYYENCELYLPKDSKWRHFRFFLSTRFKYFRLIKVDLLTLKRAGELSVSARIFRFRVIVSIVPSCK